MRYIMKAELKRAFLTNRFLILVLLGVLVHFYSLFIWEHGVIFFDFSANDINLDAAVEGIKNATNRYTFWYRGLDIYTIIMPILACLPYSTSLNLDKESNFYNYIITRTKKSSYLKSKLLANALVGGLVLALPTIIFYIILTLTVPGPIIDFGVHPIGFMSDLFMSNPNLYIFYTILIEFLFGATYATFALSVSKFNFNKIIIILTPFLYWYVGTFIFERIHLVNISPATFNAFMVRGFSNMFSIFGQAIIILTISIWIILKKNGDE